MSRITPEIINEVRKKCDIVEVISKYVVLTKRGKNYFGVCPFHDDHSPSMSVSVDKQIWTCFSCGASGNVFTFVSEYEHISFMEAVSLLAESVGITLDINNSKNKEIKNDDYDIYSIASKFYSNNINTSHGKNAIDYLNKRNIDDSTIKKFEIGLSLNKSSLTDLLTAKSYDLKKLIDLGITGENSKDLFINRIMFPIHDLNGRVVAFSGRIYQTKDSSKYINSKETSIFKKGNILYNYHRAKEHLKKNSSIIVMEGFMDVIRASVVGINNCVATMGTALTKEHILLLKKLSDNVILCFDGDSAGEDATNAAIKLLEGNDLKLKIVRLEEELDPDEYILKYGVDKFKLKIDNALNLIDYKMSTLRKDKNFTDVKDISNYIDESLKELIKLDDDVLIELMLKKLSVEFNVSYDTLNQKYLKLRGTIVKKQEEKIVIKNKKSNDPYLIAQRNLIYFMLSNIEVINMVSDRVSYMPYDKYRFLSNEIIYYASKYDDVSEANLFSYLVDNNDLLETLKEILNTDIPNDGNIMEACDDYIKVINNYVIDTKIKKTNTEIKKEVDPLVQASILNEKINIKRGVQI